MRLYFLNGHIVRYTASGRATRIITALTISAGMTTLPRLCGVTSRPSTRNISSWNNHDRPSMKPIVLRL